MGKREAYWLLARYLMALLAGIFIFIFYLIFTPLTELASLLLIKLFYNGAFLNVDTIYIGEKSIKLIPACIAGAAYYFLFLVNMVTPMENSKRFKSILLLFSSFFILNIARILLFSVLFVNEFKFIDISHLAFWYFGSTLMVVLIWFANVKLLNIRGRPFLDDIKKLVKAAKRR